MRIQQTKLAVGAAALAIAFLAGIAFAPALVGSAAAQLSGNAAQSAENRGPGGADLFQAAAGFIGITVDQLRTEMGTDKSMADVAVAHGKTRDALIAALTTAESAKITQLVDQKGAPKGPRPGGPGPGGPGPGGPGPGGRGGPGFGARIEPFQAAATYIGITAQDLQTKLRSGQTLAQIAVAAGKTRDGLIQALVQDETAKIDQAVKDGKLTADLATKLKTGLTDRITQMIDRTGPTGGPPHGFGPRGGRP